MELVKGQVVTSRAGRDKGRAYVVLQLCGDVRSGRQRAMVANGYKWTLALPKAKNPGHLQPTKTLLDASQLANDQTIQQALAAFDAGRGCIKQGG